jgi:predicted nucleotidyltransferase
MSNDKKSILTTLKEIKPTYEQEGLILLGLFGSYARDTQTKFSDIDVAYKLDYDKFSLKYKGGFAKILRIDEIKKELQAIFHTSIDLVPDTNKSILKELISV